VNGERIPMFVADYVLMEYGTGAIMAVPAHDQRDFDFAKAFGLPIRRVVEPAGGAPDDSGDEAFVDHSDNEVLVNSGRFTGMSSVEAKDAIIDWLDEQGLGHRSINYRLRDWLLSRQRYWGCPIPVVYCDKCGIVPVPDDQLPVLLPDVRDYAPQGRSPLAAAEDWVNTRCPSCGGPARRETDTLDCHFDAASQQYPLPAPTADRGESLLTHPELQRWVPVEWYINGADTGNFVLDQRTTTKMLRDLGHFTWMPDGECYRGTYTHEMVQLDGRKMSKHLGNTVVPHEIVERFGADTLRLAMLHAAAPAKAFTWDESLLTYSSGFLRRLWTFAEPRLRAASSPPHELDASDGLRRRLAGWCETAVAKITENYERLDMHRAARNLITLFERIEDFEKRVAARREPTPEDREAVLYALCLLIRLLAPVAPHIAEELWARSGSEGFVADAGWPAA
jgi:leucyl-tRNA synthetase